MLFEYLKEFSPVMQALFGTLFTWGMTAVGAASVFLFKNISRKVLDGMLGFAAGVMIAASFWSLLSPAIDLSEEMGLIPWIPALIGFLAGGIFLRIADRIMPHLHLNEEMENAEGVKTSLHKTTLLVLAITLHITLPRDQFNLALTFHCNKKHQKPIYSPLKFKV